MQCSSFRRMLALVVVVDLIGFAVSQQTASVGDVQPSARDVVHAVWLNGPTYSQKTGGIWPSYGTGTGDTSSQCTVFDSSFTGYNSNGGYCKKASNDLDNDAHLLLYSGWLAIVIDAGGISGAVPARNIFPKFGSTMSLPADASSRQVYDFLTSSTTSAELQTTCGGSYSLGTSKDDFFQIGLVRQGHTVTQISLTALEWQDADGGVMGPCGSFVPVKDPSNTNCNGFSNWPCPEAYPTCVGFVQGQSWGKCYSECTATGVPELWAELSMWADSINVELAWDSGYSFLPDGCDGTITLSIDTGSGSFSQSTTSIKSSGGKVSLFLSSRESDGVIVDGSDAAEAADQVLVTTSTSGATVVTRDGGSGGPARRDVFVEVPSSTPRCGYNMQCASLGIMMVNIVARNPHPTSKRTLRLSFSRNFPKKESTSVGSGTGAEITGLSAQLWDTTTSQATGIPFQISKNWHAGSSAAYWAGYAGYWWTASAFLRLPPNTEISLSLVLNYERYGGVSAFSHAQLSIVGYSDKWLWEESALGSSGENMCFDPLGTHTRAFITDVRPKLFDGTWKQNVGGGDFLLLFDAAGEMQYLKEMDPQIHTSGPCLSNATYTSMTRDGAMSSFVQISGGRTDDLVRMFINVRYEALKDFAFTRLAFFQLGSETYNYYATFDEFVVGGSSVPETTYAKTCSAQVHGASYTSRAASKMYTGGPQRKLMDGQAPWWFALAPNYDPNTLPDERFIVGDRGFVIREFNAKLGGVVQSSPTFSVLCDKIEIGTPEGLSALMAGDYFEMKLEILVLPRVGQEYNEAKSNVESNTLNDKLDGLTTWERVKAQALGGQLTVIPIVGARVESHYPIRVVATNAQTPSFVKFEVKGNALGFVPVVICGLASHVVPDGHGLWLKTGSATEFVQLKQGSTTGDGDGNDFWQTNYDRASGTYEIVYNVEIFEDVTVVFGSIVDDTTTQTPTTTSPPATTTLEPTTTLAATTTQTPTTPAPTQTPTTPSPTTLAPTTTTAPSTTAAPTTPAPTTPASTTLAPTTPAPTTATQTPTTSAPTTRAPTTTTAPSTTAAPTTTAPSTITETTTPTPTIGSGECIGNDSRCPGSNQAECTALQNQGADCSWTYPVSSTSASPGECLGNDSRCPGSNQAECTALQNQGADCSWTYPVSSTSASPGECLGNDSRCPGSNQAQCTALQNQGADCQWDTSSVNAEPGECLGNDSRCAGSNKGQCLRLQDQASDCVWTVSTTTSPSPSPSPSPGAGECIGNDSRCASSIQAQCAILESQGSDCRWVTLPVNPVPGECLGNDSRCANSAIAACTRLANEGASCRWESPALPGAPTGTCLGNDSRCSGKSEQSCIVLTEEGASCLWRSDFILNGTLTMQFDDTTGLSNNPNTEDAIECGLAEFVGLPCTSADVDLGPAVSRRLRRRQLSQSGPLLVTYVIVVNSNTPASFAVTGNGLNEMLKESNIDRIRSAISSSIQTNLGPFGSPDLGATLTEVGPIGLTFVSNGALTTALPTPAIDAQSSLAVFAKPMLVGSMATIFVNIL